MVPANVRIDASASGDKAVRPSIRCQVAAILLHSGSRPVLVVQASVPLADSRRPSRAAPD
jgi:hypothetical protein